MDYHTKSLLERHGLLDKSITEQVDGIITAISNLSLHKFATGVHTLYVGAIKDLTHNDAETVEQAKQACNDRAIKPCY